MVDPLRARASPERTTTSSAPRSAGPSTCSSAGSSIPTARTSWPLWFRPITSGSATSRDATETELKDLAVAWQVALLTTGKTNIEGNDLVDTSVVGLYRSPSLLSAPITDPEPGDNFGANGYQSGIDVAETNLYMDGGTTDEASEIEENAVVLGNTDHFTFVAAIPFNAAVAGAYGAHVVRVTDIPYETATLEVQSSSADLKGVLIRWNDPERVDYKVENIFSATDANNMTLPSLMDDGSEITALGTISEAEVTLMVSDEGDMATDVYDTDRWLLDLTDVTPTRRSPWPSLSTVATTMRKTWHPTTSGRQSFLRACCPRRAWMGHGEGTVMRAWTSATPHPCWTTCTTRCSSPLRPWYERRDCGLRSLRLNPGAGYRLDGYCVGGPHLRFRLGP